MSPKKSARPLRPTNRASVRSPKTTVSIGVATFPASADNVFSLFDAADEALRVLNSWPQPGVPCPAARTAPPSVPRSFIAGLGRCCRASPYLMHDDLVMSGIVGPGAPDTDDAVAGANQATLPAPVEDGRREARRGWRHLGPGQRSHSPVKRHRPHRLGVLATAKVGAGLRCLESTSAVRPE